MKNVAILMLAVGLIFAAAPGVQAIPGPSSEPGLHDIWNTIFGDTMLSTQQLIDTYGIPDGLDYFWLESGGTVNSTVRYADHDQSLGISVDGVDTVLISGVGQGFTSTSVDFNAPGGQPFRWFDRVNEGQPGEETWYSDNSDGMDHFVALQVPPEFYDAGLYDEDVFLLAFEDLSLGDLDYNDLVVLVDGLSLPPQPVPEPATLVLMGAGLSGLMGMRQRRKKNSC